ncbi:MAG TPA: hypothetical protein VGH28_30520 [Polyangiaceae bacterium]
MAPLKAVVKNGRILVDAPTELPDGTELELLPVDEMDDEERAQLLAEIDAGADDIAHGRHIDGSELLAALKARREAARR